MTNLILSFQTKVEHGCLVVRATEAEDDLSDWDPRVENWYKSGNSVIFGVLPATEGLIECDVWSESPAQKLPTELFSETIQSESGLLVIHDPNNYAQMQFRGTAGTTRISALVDDRDFPSHIQILIAN